MKTLILGCLIGLAIACADARLAFPEPEAVEADSSETTPAPPVPLPNSLKRAMDRSATDVVVERRKDGVSRVDLRGGFQSVSMVVRDDAGQLQRVCTDHPNIAVRVFRGEQ